MKKTVFIISLWLLSAISISAQTVNVDSLDRDAEEITIPKCHKLSSSFKGKGFDKLRKVTFEGIEFLDGLTFSELPALEEVVFNGDNINIGGAQYVRLPKLKRVVMNGNTFIINGGVAVVECPEFEDFVINGLVSYSDMGDPWNAPKFKGYSGEFAMMNNNGSEIITSTPASVIAQNPEYVAAFRRQFSRVSEALADYEKDEEFAGRFIWFRDEFVSLAEQLGVDTTDFLKAYAKAKENPSYWTNIETLQHSPTYAADTVTLRFTYQPASSEALAETRLRFNLDSIAGGGDDISRIKNLTYWVHDLVTHNGNSYNPSGPKTLANLVDTCRQYDRGVNCRMMAIMLTEALLAEGIPARYLTCQSKAFDTDPDCHVICVAWADSLRKWVWADPTFAAFVTDDEGLMLHPGEVRARLIDGRPLNLNKDANWNHKSPQTKENYLDNYMAKNLYYITAITDNRQGPEGDTMRSTYVTLSPVNSNFEGSHILTTDSEKFWQAPE